MLKTYFSKLNKIKIINYFTKRHVCWSKAQTQSPRLSEPAAKRVPLQFHEIVRTPKS